MAKSQNKNSVKSAGMERIAYQSNQTRNAIKAEFTHSQEQNDQVVNARKAANLAAAKEKAKKKAKMAKASRKKNKK